MKSLISMTGLFLCVVALLAGASAQQDLNFGKLPPVKVPEPMPAGYGELDWDNVFYVNPYAWPGSGPGDKLGLNGEDIAFIGAKDCRLADNVCFGKLTNARGFSAVNAQIAASYGPTQVVVRAYDHGRFLGSISIFASTLRRVLNFPHRGELLPSLTSR